MNELMEQVDNLMDELDSCEMVSSIKEIRGKISADKELTSLLEEYSYYPSEKLKEKIISHPLFQEYKIKETELNLFIMDMNQRLKKISKKGTCQK